jgi:parvulin-like peptidyl-prolyl isomerase
MVNLIQISSLFRQGRIAFFVRPCLPATRLAQQGFSRGGRVALAQARRVGRPNKMSVHVRVCLRLIHISVFCGFILLCGVSGCSSKTETPAENQVVIRVDDRVLTLAEFNEYFEAINPGNDREDDKDSTAIREARFGFLLQLVEEMIVLRRADELHLQISPQELDEAVLDFKKDYPETAFEDLFLKQAVSFEAWRERLGRRLLVEKVIRNELLKEDSATPREIRDYYDKHHKEWSRGEEIRARHILVPSGDQANNVLEQLQNGHDFAKLVRLHSMAPEALDGGDMGYIARGQLPSSLEEPLFDLEPGNLSPVIETPYGFHIFQVIEKREKSVPNVEESIERIRQEMQKERLEVAYGPWLAELRSRYYIEINKEII